MSPVSRGRKKTKRRGTRPARQHQPIWRLVLDQAAHLLEAGTPLKVELWASAIVGSLWHAAWESAASEADAEDLLDEHHADLMRRLGRAGTPAALLALRAFAEVGHGWHRDIAAVEVDALETSGVTCPEWSMEIGFSALTEAYSIKDTLGDLEFVALQFTEAKQPHTLLVAIAHADGPRLAAVLSSPTIRDLDSLPGAESLRPPVQLTQEEALELVDTAVIHLLEDGPESSELYSEVLTGEHHDQDDTVSRYWPLLMARSDDLDAEIDAAAVAPGDLDGDDLDGDDFDEEGLDDEDVGVLDDAMRDVAGTAGARFLDDRRTERLPDRALAEAWARFATLWTLECDEPLYHCGPLSLTTMLAGVVVEHVVLTDAEFAAVPDVIRAWAHFTADAAELPDEAHQVWDEHLPDLLERFVTEYVKPEVVAHRSSCPSARPLGWFFQRFDAGEAGASVDDPPTELHSEP